MNYLAELKAFYDRLEINPLPSPAIALWHALMSIANKTGWQQEFTVAMSILVLKSGLSESAVKRARNRLSQDGFITWKSRSGNQSAVYSIISIAVQYDPQSEPQSGRQSEPHTVPQSEPQSGRINKLKQNNTFILTGDDGVNNIYSRARALSESLLMKYWGRAPTDADIDHVHGFIVCVKGGNVKISEDKAQLLAYAFECSVKANALNWNYIQGVWDRLRARGIENIDQAYEFDVRREFGG